MMRRAVAVFAVTCAGTMAGGCAPTDVANGAAETPVEIPLRPYLGRLVTVDAVIAGDTVHLLFDTGGGQTIISPRVATAVGCASSGRSAGFRMSGERVDFPLCGGVTLALGGRVIAMERVGVWDVQAVLPAGAPAVDGVLSLEALSDQLFTLSFPAQQLILETPASLQQRVATMRAVRSRIATGADGDELTVFVHGTVRGARSDSGWFLLDSGNLDAVQLAPHLDANAAGDSASGSAGTWTGQLAIDGWPASAARFRRRPLIYDGALSEEFLRNWTFSFDLRAAKVWAERSP